MQLVAAARGVAVDIVQLVGDGIIIGAALFDLRLDLVDPPELFFNDILDVGGGILRFFDLTEDTRNIIVIMEDIIFRYGDHRALFGDLRFMCRRA